MVLGCVKTSSIAPFIVVLLGSRVCIGCPFQVDCRAIVESGQGFQVDVWNSANTLRNRLKSDGSA